MASPLVEALIKREDDLRKESPWLSASNSLLSKPVANTEAPLWKNLVASLGQGLTAGLMRGYGDYAINKQMQDDVTTLKSPGVNAPSAWTGRYAPYAIAQALAQEDAQNTLNLDIEKAKQLKQIDLEMLPQIEAAKKAAELGGSEYISKQEDEAFGRIINQQVTKDYATTKVQLDKIRSLAADDSRAGNIALVYQFAKINDPGSAVREGEIVLSASAAPWLQRMIAGANSQLSGKGFLEPDTKTAILGTAEMQAEALRTNYETLAQRVGAIAQDRTQGRAQPSRMYPIELGATIPAAVEAAPAPAGNGFTGWATNKAGVRAHFTNGIAD